MILNFLIVGFGGAVGSMLRYGVGVICTKYFTSTFPWAIFGINITGSFLIALTLSLMLGTQEPHDGLKLFLTVGILGGFTTFSTFSMDAITILERGQYLQAAFYVLGSVLLSLIAAFLGLFLARTFVG